MSQLRIKRSKLRGSNGKSMKSENSASQKLLLEAQDSADVRDFLYVDRSRISSLYAQLFPQGILTNVKTTANQSSTSQNDIGSDLKIFKAESKTSDIASEGIEHLFDASWSVPLDVLAALIDRGLVASSLQDAAGLGSLVITEAHLRVVDFASMEKLWPYAAKAAVQTGQIEEDQANNLVDVFRALPSTIQAHFLTTEGLLWSTLIHGGLNIPTTDLTLKYGGSLQGSWKVLYIIDAWPDVAEVAGTTDGSDIWSSGPLSDAVRTAAGAIRGILGRPADWFGITPLLIFRSTRRP